MLFRSSALLDVDQLSVPVSVVLVVELSKNQSLFSVNSSSRFIANIVIWSTPITWAPLFVLNCNLMSSFVAFQTVNQVYVVRVEVVIGSITISLPSNGVVPCTARIPKSPAGSLPSIRPVKTNRYLSSTLKLDDGMTAPDMSTYVVLEVVERVVSSTNV